MKSSKSFVLFMPRSVLPLSALISGSLCAFLIQAYFSWINLAFDLGLEYRFRYLLLLVHIIFLLTGLFHLFNFVQNKKWFDGLSHIFLCTGTLVSLPFYFGYTIFLTPILWITLFFPLVVTTWIRWSGFINLGKYIIRGKHWMVFLMSGIITGTLGLLFFGGIFWGVKQTIIPFEIFSQNQNNIIKLNQRVSSSQSLNLNHIMDLLPKTPKLTDLILSFHYSQIQGENLDYSEEDRKKYYPFFFLEKVVERIEGPLSRSQDVTGLNKALKINIAIFEEFYHKFSSLIEPFRYCNKHLSSEELKNREGKFLAKKCLGKLTASYEEAFGMDNFFVSVVSEHYSLLKKLNQQLNSLQKQDFYRANEFFKLSILQNTLQPDFNTSPKEFENPIQILNKIHIWKKSSFFYFPILTNNQREKADTNCKKEASSKKVRYTCDFWALSPSDNKIHFFLRARVIYEKNSLLELYVGLPIESVDGKELRKQLIDGLGKEFNKKDEKSNSYSFSREGNTMKIYFPKKEKNNVLEFYVRSVE